MLRQWQFPPRWDLFWFWTQFISPRLHLSRWLISVKSGRYRWVKRIANEYGMHFWTNCSFLKERTKIILENNVLLQRYCSSKKGVALRLFRCSLCKSPMTFNQHNDSRTTFFFHLPMQYKLHCIEWMDWKWIKKNSFLRKHLSISNLMVRSGRKSEDQHGGRPPNLLMEPITTRKLHLRRKGKRPPHHQLQNK